MDNATYIDGFLREMAAVVERLPRTQIAAAVDLLLETWERRGTVFIAGNGGSAATASHFACDLAKWTAVEGQPRFRVLALTDNMPLYSALVNDEGPASVFADQLEPFIGAGDVLILISVHGGSGAGNAGSWSQNLLRALQLAHQRGARVLGLSGFDGGALGEMADVCVVVPADSTPQVESFHMALEHLICDCLRTRIAARAAGQGG
ncbi:MAG: SIS domain-containing protein [Gemmatimonadota bacterium]